MNCPLLSHAKAMRNPTVEYKIIVDSDKIYNAFLDNISFNTFINAPKEITIECLNSEAEVKSIFFYAKIVDSNDHITYINTDGIVIDDIPPVIEGLEDGNTYPKDTSITIKEDETLSINGTVIETVNSSFVFTEEGDFEITVTDKAGNSTTIHISIVHEHIFVDSGETHTCTICNLSELHAFSEDYIIDAEATYSAVGSKSKHCTKCAAKSNMTEIPSKNILHMF